MKHDCYFADLPLDIQWVLKQNQKRFT